MRVGIVGCGKIADQHVHAIDRVGGCTVVAVCDQEPLMAEQLAERFHIQGVYRELSELLEKTAVDVVHITTPPQSHLQLAQQCIEHGVNVYVEKPFTVTAAEAELLFALAAERKVALIAGHNYQFTPEMLRMRQLAGQGYFGEQVVHIESHFSYDLDDVKYVAPILNDKNHWVRRLPGQLFHNLLSHGIARLAEFLDDEIIDAQVTTYQSPRMAALGGNEVLDELRVSMRDRRNTTAYFCFSTRISPGVNRLVIYGTKNSLTVDLTSGAVILHKSGAYRSYLTFVGPPVNSGRQHLENAVRNSWAIARRRLYHDAGMTELVRRFYHAIRNNTPLPVSPREVVLTARIMDEIFARAYPRTQETCSQPHDLAC